MSARLHSARATAAALTLLRNAPAAGGSPPGGESPAHRNVALDLDGQADAPWRVRGVERYRSAP